MNKVFTKQINRNIKVYADDMVAKISEKHDHYSDLTEIFSQLRQHNMRLNLDKCIFGVQVGKFLGFMLTSREIEANPDKCEAILAMPSPVSIKEVQYPTGWIIALSRFLPKLVDREKPFLQCLKKSVKF